MHSLPLFFIKLIMKKLIASSQCVKIEIGAFEITTVTIYFLQFCTVMKCGLDVVF